MYTTPIRKSEEIAMMLLFFGQFLVISEVGSPDFIMKSAVVVFGVFPLIFLHEITLSAIYIHNIGCSEPFLPPRTTLKFGGF